MRWLLYVGVFVACLQFAYIAELLTQHQAQEVVDDAVATSEAFARRPKRAIEYEYRPPPPPEPPKPALRRPEPAAAAPGRAAAPFRMERAAPKPAAPPRGAAAWSPPAAAFADRAATAGQAAWRRYACLLYTSPSPRDRG